jgi:hypothetical protein
MPAEKGILSRRDFIKAAGAAGLGSALGPLSPLTAAHAGTSTKGPEQMGVPTRSFGKTGVDVSILSLGGVLRWVAGTSIGLSFDRRYSCCCLHGIPRKARLDTPGALHPIIVGGIERRKIFCVDSDRNDSIKRLGGAGGVRELGLTTVELVCRLNLAQPTGSQSADRGERIAAEKQVTLLFK